jgi:mannose-6-phosphate isomerase
LIQVQKGDSIYVPAGQIHAIGAGSSLLEVQQNSNTTYRLYDWGRNNRPLHLKEGLACIDWKQKKTPQLISQLLEENIAYQRELLVNSPNFIIERVKVRSRWNPPLDETTFQMFFCQSGSCKVMCNHHIECLPLSAICLIPASAQSLNIEGVCELIWIRLS